MLKKDEGGRHTPFFTKYRPQFYFRTTDVTGEVELPAGTEMVMPGDDAKFTVKLITPIAIGVINLTVNLASSPGITISVPAGNSTSPVTSVVLK